MTQPSLHDENQGGFACQTYRQRFSVPFEFPVCFTRDLFNPANPLLARVIDRLGERRRHRCAVFVDAGVAATGLPDRVREYFHAHPEQLELAAGPEIIRGGEQAKTGWDVVRNVMWTLGNVHLDRQSCVLAAGGGGLLDMVGFATSIVHRGLRLVRVPTTALAQNDAGVGVKNGMDEHGQKNFVGTFAPPFAVLNDFALLASLPFGQWIGGAAEAFKVAIIKDADFFDYLCAHAANLARRDEAVMETLIRRCAVLHLEHIAGGGDPFEMGTARPLDLGHWAAHRLEIMSQFTLTHGQAVAIGLAMDSYYAMRQGLLAQQDLDRLLAGLCGCGLPVYHELLQHRDEAGVLAVMEGLENFREHLGGRLTVTLPHGVGAKVEVHQINPDIVEQAIAFLRDYRGQSAREALP